MPKSVPDDPLVPVWERLDSLIDGLATSNRAAIAHRRELARTRDMILIAGLFLFVLYMKGQ